MAKKVGTGKPGGRCVVRHPKSGRRKNDLVKFCPNSSSAGEPGKMKPRKVVKDAPPRSPLKKGGSSKRGKRSHRK